MKNYNVVRVQVVKSEENKADLFTKCFRNSEFKALSGWLDLYRDRGPTSILGVSCILGLGIYSLTPIQYMVMVAIRVAVPRC